MDVKEAYLYESREKENKLKFPSSAEIFSSYLFRPSVGKREVSLDERKHKSVHTYINKKSVIGAKSGSCLHCGDGKELLRRLE